MYKPYTVEQYKICRYLKEKEGFVLEHFILSPLSRNALLLEDGTGEQIVFEIQGERIQEAEMPIPAGKEEIELFCKEFKENPLSPVLTNFEDVTKWWHNVPNPFTYQQALGLRDDLYRHFLAHDLYDTEDVKRVAEQGVVTEEELNGIYVWYRNGNFRSCYLGWYGLNGTGDYYRLVLHSGKPEEISYQFYIENEYYRCMNSKK